MDNDNYDYPYENFEYVESYAGLPVSRGFQQSGHHNNHHHNHHQPLQQQNQNHLQYQQQQFNHHYNHQQQQPQNYQLQSQQFQQESSDHYQVHQVNSSSSGHLYHMDPGHLQASGISAVAATGSSPSSIISNNSGSTSHSTVSTFTNLAKTVNVKLPKSLTKYVLSFYFFLFVFLHFCLTFFSNYVDI